MCIRDRGDNQMILVGQKSLFANGITFILFGFYTVYSSLFLALGKGAAGFFLGACRQGVCFVPVILLLPMVWGMNGTKQIPCLHAPKKKPAAPLPLSLIHISREVRRFILTKSIKSNTIIYSKFDSILSCRKHSERV